MKSNSECFYYKFLNITYLFSRRNLYFKSLSSKNTAELATLQEKRNVLAHRIANWQKIQDIYMPLAASLRSPMETTDTDGEPITISDNAEKIKLLLPSGCPSSIRSLDSLKTLISQETQLRTAQAYDALAYIQKL